LAPLVFVSHREYIGTAVGSLRVDAPDDMPETGGLGAEAVAGKSGRCGLHAVSIMRTLCPTCVVIGLAMLPVELVIRAVMRLVRGPAGSPPTTGYPDPR